MVALLLKAGANADIPDISGVSPRQAAEKSGNRALITLFIQRPEGNKENTP
jgi:ankyrin repeat protein